MSTERLVGPDITTTTNTQGFTLGTEYVDKDKTTYRYVYATEAKTAYVPQFIDVTNKLHSLAVTSASANLAAQMIGVPQITWAAPATGFANRFGWVPVKGPMLASTTCKLTAPANLCINTTGGFSWKHNTNCSVVPGLTLRSTVTTLLNAQTGVVAQDYMVPVL